MITNTIIPVTEEHIEKGEKEDPASCPIALAIRDKLGEESYPEVLSHEFIIFLDGSRHDGTIDEEIANKIKEYDTNEEMKPMNIIIEIEDDFMTIKSEE